MYLFSFLTDCGPVATRTQQGPEVLLPETGTWLSGVRMQLVQAGAQAEGEFSVKRTSGCPAGVAQWLSVDL